MLIFDIKVAALATSSPKSQIATHESMTVPINLLLGDVSCMNNLVDYLIAAQIEYNEIRVISVTKNPTNTIFHWYLYVQIMIWL